MGFHPLRSWHVDAGTRCQVDRPVARVATFFSDRNYMPDGLQAQPVRCWFNNIANNTNSPNISTSGVPNKRSGALR